MKEVEINLYLSVYHFSTFIVNPRNISVNRKFASIHHILLLQLHHHLLPFTLGRWTNRPFPLDCHLPIYIFFCIIILTHLYSYSFIFIYILFCPIKSLHFKDSIPFITTCSHLLEVDGQSGPFHCTIPSVSNALHSLSLYIKDSIF